MAAAAHAAPCSARMRRPISAARPRRSPGLRPAQPESNTRRTRTSLAASSTKALTSSGSSVLMLPKPTATGGGPSSRNRARPAGGTKLLGSSTNQKPVIWASSGGALGDRRELPKGGDHSAPLDRAVRLYAQELSRDVERERRDVELVATHELLVVQGGHDRTVVPERLKRLTDRDVGLDVTAASRGEDRSSQAGLHFIATRCCTVVRTVFADGGTPQTRRRLQSMWSAPAQAAPRLASGSDRRGRRFGWRGYCRSSRSSPRPSRPPG